MSIFLGYGLGLGVVGSGLGMVIGLLIVNYLDSIEDFLSRMSGRHIFDPDLYYFDKIPTMIDGFNIAWIVLGAMLIAVAASVLPAWRAARLRPVQSLRYE
jgi:lipoprotein-releasing system permease protein